MAASFGASLKPLANPGDSAVSLVLFGHPFSSCTQKVLIALYIQYL